MIMSGIIITATTPIGRIIPTTTAGPIIIRRARSSRSCHSSMVGKSHGCGERLNFRHCKPTGPREALPDDRLREAIHGHAKILDCFVAMVSRSDEKCCGQRFLNPVGELPGL